MRPLLVLCLCLILISGTPEGLFLRPVQAQWSDSIDDVIEGLDSQFDFGGKEEVKRSNLETANETNREDIQIVLEEKRQAALLASAASSVVSLVSFSLTEGGMPSSVESITVTFGGQTLVVGLDGATQTVSVNALTGSTQTLSISCFGIGACEYEVTILSGATFVGGGNSTGFQTGLGAGSGPVTFSVLVT